MTGTGGKIVGETKYSKVKSWIKSNILDGTFEPKQKISSESKLMDQFNVSRHTVRLAIGELVSEGWLYREQGSGTYVSDRASMEVGKSEHTQKKIAIITTYISDYIFPSIIRGAEKVLSKEGYQVSLFSTNNDHEKEKQILETIIPQRFDGLIIEPTKSATSNPNIKYYLHLELLGIPYIMINAYYDELEPLHVTVDDEAGGYLQTNHLLELGHTNILAFFKTDDMQGTKRMKGYLKAYRATGVPINPKNIVTYDTAGKFNVPVQVLTNVLKRSTDKPTAIICYNDELAMKLLDVTRQFHVSVPDDLSLVGFDDSFFAEVSEVKLTSVSHPKSELGEVAAKTIISLIRKTAGGSLGQIESPVFTPSLVIRNSTKAIDNH
ncbi:GntR family transcriptional regulator [Shouchella clausii]|nr:GntR family transcriptional regulator [Shouchella clausii]PAD94267.1 GntR family transcriptional regulator [Shouchella clausii]PTL23784.1 GntR family transcriptional regulator [Shouchella clausii]QNM42773.1 GntR family transcriptional regulator [Shouchella clausii]